MLAIIIILVLDVMTHDVDCYVNSRVIVILEFDFLFIVLHQMVNVSRGSTNSIRLSGWSCDGVHVVMTRGSYEVGADCKSNQDSTMLPCGWMGFVGAGCMYQSCTQGKTILWRHQHCL